MTREVTALPKAHLHLHFTGSMRVETVRDLARQHGIRLPEALVTGYPPKLARATDERGWFRFQRLYDAARACVRGEADMRRIVREAAEDDADEGSRWLAIHQTRLGSCALAGITNPRTYLRDVLTKLSRGWPQSRLGELSPAAWLASRATEG